MANAKMDSIEVTRTVEEDVVVLTLSVEEAKCLVALLNITGGQPSKVTSSFKKDAPRGILTDAEDSPFFALRQAVGSWRFDSLVGDSAYQSLAGAYIPGDSTLERTG